MVVCFSGNEIPTDFGNSQLKEDGLPYMIAKSFKDGIALKQNQLIKLGRT